MKKTTSPNDPQSPAVPELLEIARELNVLRDEVDLLHSEMQARDEKIEWGRQVAQVGGAAANKRIACFQTIRKIGELVQSETPARAFIVMLSKGQGALATGLLRGFEHLAPDRR